MKSVSLKTRLAMKTSLKKKGVQKEYVSKQGRKSVKSSKGESSVHKDLCTEATVSTVKPNKGIDKRNKGTDKQIEILRGPVLLLQDYVKHLYASSQIASKRLRQKRMSDVGGMVQEEWEAEKEKIRLAEEEATKVALTNERRQYKVDFWNNQQEWEIVRWRLYEACGVWILVLKDGTIIYMLVERKYPLSKELLQQMLDFRIAVEAVLTQLVLFLSDYKFFLSSADDSFKTLLLTSALVIDETLVVHMACLLS
ncbi:hypothetical protein Tco_0433020 [Tanacetum coccineum]